MNALHLSNNRHINSASVNTMTLAMSNEPIANVVSASRLQGYIMAYIPFLAGDNFHVAQVTNALVP